ncbi:MAG: FAD/NAD(P)-binding protein [Burkholderiaceae bacterium]
MKPDFLKVIDCIRETDDVVTLRLARPGDETKVQPFQPGQFNMLYAFGVGEVPVSMSGDASQTEFLEHTVRAVGPVSLALTRLAQDEQVGVRGPFGTAWPADQAVGGDLLIIAGGIGLAPLRPLLYQVLGHRNQYREIALLYGARSPEDLLYRGELEVWRRRPDLQVRVTVDRADASWTGDVGVVTQQLSRVSTDLSKTTVMICGPEIMIRLTCAALLDAGIQQSQIFVSMERNMKCAVGQCGHCQVGSYFVCRDGPVFPFGQVQRLMNIREI